VQAKVCKLFKECVECGQILQKLKPERLLQNIAQKNYHRTDLTLSYQWASSIAFDRDFLFVGGGFRGSGNAGFLKIWNKIAKDNFQEFQELKITGSISKLRFEDGNLFALSSSKTKKALQILKEQEGCFKEIQCIIIENIDPEAVYFEYHKGKLFIKAEGCIEIYKKNETTSLFEKDQTLKVNSYCFCCQGDFLFCAKFFGVNYGHVEIWKEVQDRFVKISSFLAHESNISCIYKHGNLLFTGSYDKKIKIWEQDESGVFKLIQTLEGHKNTISAMTFRDHFLFTGSWDKTIRVWEKKENGFIENIQLLSPGVDNEYAIFSLKFFHDLLVAGTTQDVKVFDLYQKNTQK
jgi:WD40 repeat protein